MKRLEQLTQEWKGEGLLLPIWAEDDILVRDGNIVEIGQNLTMDRGGSPVYGGSAEAA